MCVCARACVCAHVCVCVSVGVFVCTCWSQTEGIVLAASLALQYAGLQSGSVMTTGWFTFVSAPRPSF